MNLHLVLLIPTENYHCVRLKLLIAFLQLRFMHAHRYPSRLRPGPETGLASLYAMSSLVHQFDDSRFKALGIRFGSPALWE